MKRLWMFLTLAGLVMTICTILPGVATAAETPFNGSYVQVKGFLWEADNNTITFDGSANTFTGSVNMYEGYYKFSGTFTMKSNQAFCTVTDNSPYKGKSFTMTDINGNLLFDGDEKIASIVPSALFKNTNNTVQTPELPWESAYMATIKACKAEQESFSFALYDIDEDSIPELFLSWYGDYNVYTYKNGAVVDLGGVHNHLYKAVEKNSILTCGGLGIGMRGGMVYAIENGQLSEPGIAFFADVNNEAPKEQYYINNQYVSESEYQLQEAKYTDSANQINAVYCDKYVYIPAETRLQDYVTRRGGVAKQEIKVVLDEKPMVFDQPPVLEGGRTLVPVRAIFEALGANVTWNADTKTVIAKKGETTIEIQIDNNIMRKNDQKYQLDVPAKIIGSRTLVPLRAVSEALSARVAWDAATQTVSLTSHEQYVRNFANALWAQLNQQQIDKVIKGRVTGDTEALKAMLSCQAQASWNNVTLDVTSAAVGATLTVYELSHGDISGVKDTINGFISDVIVEVLPTVSPDDFIWNTANNAANNNYALNTKFVALHVSTQGQMDYDTSVKYITMYQTLQMNSNSVVMGMNYFKNKLPDDAPEALTQTLTKVLVDFASDKIKMIDANGVLDGVIKNEVLDTWNALIELNNPDISTWAKENKRLQEQLMDILS